MGILVILVALAAAFCVLTAARHFYYVAMDVGGTGGPTAPLQHPEQSGVPGLSNVTFASRDGSRSSGWYVPAKNGAALIVSTGTDANRMTMLAEIRILAAAGFGVLAFDWPGTGLSGGKIDWGRGAPAALEGAIDWLAQRPDVNPARIGAVGFSAGGTITVRVAAVDQRLSAVVLIGTSPSSNESPFLFHRSKEPLKVLPAEWAARWYGWPVGKSRPIDLIGKLAPRPLFIIGGSGDPNATPAMSAELFAAAGEPKELWIAPISGHGQYAEAAPEEYAHRLVGFLNRYLSNGSAPRKVKPP